MHLQMRPPLAEVPRAAVLQIHQRLQIGSEIGAVSQSVQLVEIQSDVDDRKDDRGDVRPTSSVRRDRFVDDGAQSLDEARRRKRLGVCA